jgi:hypothetical protein
VVIGGVALNLHGGDNLTLDMDISFARDRANATALATALARHSPRLRGVPADLPSSVDSHLIRNATVLTMTTDLGDFDMLAEPTGVDSFEGLYQRAAIMEVDGMEIRVASLDDLAAMKRAAGRPKDLTHIMTIEALKRLQARPDVEH